MIFELQDWLFPLNKNKTKCLNAMNENNYKWITEFLFYLRFFLISMFSFLAVPSFHALIFIIFIFSNIKESHNVKISDRKYTYSSGDEFFQKLVLIVIRPKLFRFIFTWYNYKQIIQHKRRNRHRFIISFVSFLWSDIQFYFQNIFSPMHSVYHIIHKKKQNQ